MIIFDLDGTLADCEHRRHFVEKGHPKNFQDVKLEYGDTIEIKKDGSFEITNRMDRLDWKPDYQAFYEACDQDKPIESVCKVFDDLAIDNEIEIWSGRCESVREKTIEWLYEHIPYSGQTLKMRPIGDKIPDDILKEIWLDEAIAEGKKIDFVFDDRPKVVRMWRRRGVFVFNCCQHEEEF